MITFLLLLIPSLIVIYLLSFFIYQLWYNRNYKTHTQTNKHDIGWNKCWVCKEVEPTMYYEYNFFGRIYKCKKHRK